MSQNLEQSLSDQSGVFSSALTAGAMLSAQRQRLGLSLEDVASKLKLAKRQIEALEADRFDALPGNTIVRGFVRNYARLLEIDPQPLLDDLAKHLPPEAVQAALPRLQDEAMPMLRPRGAGKNSSFFVALVIALLVALGLAAAWFYFNGKHEPLLTFGGSFGAAEPTTPAAAEHAAVTPMPTSDTSPTNTEAPAADTAVHNDSAAATASDAAQVVPAPAANLTPAVTTPTPVPAVQPALPAPQAAPQQAAKAPAQVVVPTLPTQEVKPSATSSANEVTVVAKEDSWVQIVDASGKRLVGEMVKAGDRRTVTGKAPYQVRIGNAHHAELFYNGQPTDLTPHIRVDVANIELK